MKNTDQIERRMKEAARDLTDKRAGKAEEKVDALKDRIHELSRSK
jgi:hypothetical protein